MYTPKLARSEAYHRWSGSLDSTEIVMVHLVEVRSGGHLNVVKVWGPAGGRYIVESWGPVLNQPGEFSVRAADAHGPIGGLVCKLVVSRGRRDVKILPGDAYTVHDVFYLCCA